MRRLAAAAVVLLVVLIAARWPVTTAVGVNYHVSIKPLTLLEKAVAFLDHDFELRRLTRDVVGSEGSAEQRLLRMYEWVAGNIHPVPPGWPVIDDHIVNIFVRGYGALDQRAEALAALASYSGMPATTVGVGKNPNHLIVQLTVVRLDDRLVVFDVNNHIVFRRPSGDLAAFEDLVTDPSIIALAGAGLVVDDVPYEQHFQRLGAANLQFTRMEKQRLWPRLKDELMERLLGS